MRGGAGEGVTVVLQEWCVANVLQYLIVKPSPCGDTRSR